MLYDVEVRYIDEANVIIKYIWHKNSRPTQVKNAMERIEDTKLYKNLTKKYDVAYMSCFREDHPPAMSDELIEEAFLRIMEKEGKILDSYIETVTEAESELNKHIKDLFAK